MALAVRAFILAVGLAVVICDDGAAQDLTLIGPDFPPYYEIDAAGEMTGELVVLYDRILSHAGLVWRGVGVRPAKRTMVDLVAGAADSSLLVDNPLLSDRPHIIRTREPVGELVLNLYGARPLPFAMDRMAMQDQRVAVMRGYGYGGLRAWLDNPANRVEIREFNSEAPAIRFVDAGRADFALLYDVGFENAIAEIGAWPSNIRVANLQRVPLYIHINRQTVADADAVRARIEASHAALVREGVLPAVRDNEGS